MARTFCGFGSADDPEHLRQCIVCNKAVWREYRREHPGLLRRWLHRLLPTPDPMPVPPTVEQRIPDRSEQ